MCPRSIRRPCNWCNGRGMKVVFETARMYTGPEPVMPLDRLFGVTTFELG